MSTWEIDSEFGIESESQTEANADNVGNLSTQIHSVAFESETRKVMFHMQSECEITLLEQGLFKTLADFVTTMWFNNDEIEFHINEHNIMTTEDEKYVVVHYELLNATSKVQKVMNDAMKTISDIIFEHHCFSEFANEEKVNKNCSVDITDRIKQWQLDNQLVSADEMFPFGHEIQEVTEMDLNHENVLNFLAKSYSSKALFLTDNKMLMNAAFELSPKIAVMSLRVRHLFDELERKENDNTVRFVNLKSSKFWRKPEKRNIFTVQDFLEKEKEDEFDMEVDKLMVRDTFDTFEMFDVFDKFDEDSECHLLPCLFV